MSREETLEGAKVALKLAHEAIHVRRDHAAGIELAQQSLAQCQAAQWGEGIADSLVNLAICQQFLGDFASALISNIAALEAHGPDAAPKIRATVKNNIANVYLQMLDFGAAVKFYQEALELMERSGDLQSIVKLHLNLCNGYCQAGDLEPAFESVQRALQAIEGKNYQGSRARIYQQLARLFSEKGDVVAALTNVELEFEDLRQFPDKWKECEAWIMKSVILSQTTKSEDGLIAAEHALRLAREMGSPFLEAQSLKNGGLFIERLGRHEEAMDRYQLAAEQFHTLKSFDMEAIALRASGELLLSQDSKAAIAVLLRSFEAAELSKAKREIALSHEALSKAYKQFGETDGALQHFELFHEIEFQRRSEDRERQLSVMKANAETEFQRLLAVSSERETEVQQLRAEQAEQELSMSTLQLLAQTELLSDLRSDLLQIARKIPPTEAAAKELRERVKNLPCKAVDWEKFDTQFRAVHPEFSKKLIEKCPELTATELRICSLLRMNLKSEAIAQLFCLSERTVENHRMHIRKKLKLKAGEDLFKVFGAY
jgi:tetratricopeptide (TPR) repeat protein